MRSVRCPVLVGREDDLQVLSESIEGAARGRGGAVLLLGEAGIGKSRLVEAGAAAARTRGMKVLRGRASPSPAPAPYRPIAEVLLSVLRTSGPPQFPDLPWVRPALSLIVPSWRPSNAEPLADPSVVLLGEAVLALLRDVSRGQGALVVLEDLQWGDPGTIELLEYLVDKLEACSVAVAGTIRSGEASPAEELVRSLQARRQATVVELSRLSPRDVTQMVAASIGVDAVPADLVSVIQEGSEGLPFLVEELLGSLVAAGALARGDDGWQVRTALRPAVPPSFTAGVEERLGRLPPSARRIVQSAAVLGDHFDWELLQAVTEADDESIAAALRHGAELQLLEEDRAGRVYRFRHALTRGAVVATLLPHERRALSARALATLDVGEDSGLERLELAAQVADATGEHHRATELLLASASMALRQGAVSSAAESAEKVLARNPSPEAAQQAEATLLDAAVVAGNHPRAIEVGEVLLARYEIASAPATSLAGVHLRLAESALTATDWPRVEHHLERAGALTPAGEEELVTRRQLLHGRLRLGQHRLDEAAASVREALDTAQRLDLDDLLYQCLELMGRVHRPWDVGEAEHWFIQALVTAERSASKRAYVSALFELGVIDVMRLRSPDRLRRAHRLALELGMPVVAAQASLHLAVLLFSFFDLAEARAAAQEAHDVALRYQLGLLVPAALCVAGAVDAAMGRRAEAFAFFERARPFMDPESEANGRGQVLAQAALALEDRAAALEELSLAEALSPPRSAVTRSTFRGFLALLLALETNGPVPIVEELRNETPSLHIVAAALADLAQAVLTGRAGDARGAEAQFAAADRVLAPAPWFRMFGRRLVAEAAIRDGWGSPVMWLSEAAAFFEGAGIEEPARACRSLLRSAGSALPPADIEIEGTLGAITPREADVLALVAEGLSNKDIAERLYLSPRTVEKHVERLLLKTGARNRAQLAALVGRRRRLRR